MAEKVKFKSHAEEVKNGILEQEKLALRATAKILKAASRERVPIRTKALYKVIATWVRVDKKTGTVKLELGVYGDKKAKQKGLAPAGFRAHFIEFGTRHNAAVSFLREPTLQHVPEIRRAQAQFMPGIRHVSMFNGVDEEVE